MRFMNRWGSSTDLLARQVPCGRWLVWERACREYGVSVSDRLTDTPLSRAARPHIKPVPVVWLVFGFATAHQVVRRGDDEQGEQRRGEHAADHWRGDAAHDFAASAVAQ